MTRFLVDTSVIVDVLSRDATWFDWSADMLARCAAEGPLAINPIIYAELAVGFPRVEVLDAALPEPDWVRLPLPWHAGFLAGDASGHIGIAAARDQAPCPTSTLAPMPPWRVSWSSPGMPLATGRISRRSSW